MTTTRPRQSPAGTAPRRSTRSTRSTRPAPAGQTQQAAKPQRPASQKRIIRTEPVTQAVQAAPEPPPRGRVRKSTRRADAEAPSRVVIQTEKREEARFKAPMQFLAVMFGVVVISVLAFGMLRGDTPPETVQDDPDGEEVRFEGPNSTSTNTGILRSSHGQ